MLCVMCYVTGIKCQVSSTKYYNMSNELHK